MGKVIDTLVWFNTNLATLFGVIAASVFAYYQFKINKRQYILSKSQLYINNSVELSMFLAELPNLIKNSLSGEPQIIEDACNTIDKIYFNAQLYLSKDIVDYITPIQTLLKLIRYYYDNYLYCKSIIKTLELDPTKSINFRKEVMYCGGVAYYDNSISVAQYKYKDIQNLNLYCDAQIKLAEQKKNEICTLTLVGKYNTYNICKKYSKYTLTK